jgi:hypothetical protein
MRFVLSLQEETKTGETPMKTSISFITPSRLPHSKRVSDFREGDESKKEEPAKKRLTYESKNESINE